MAERVRQTTPSARQDLRVYWHSLRLQIRAAMALRGAFFVQIGGMVVNNTALIVAWLFLFEQFGTINGWQARELIGMMGIGMLVFGVVMFLSQGIQDLPRHVDRGSLDGMLTKPSPVLMQLAGNRVDATVFGDFAMGLGITVWYFAVSDVSLAEASVFLLSLAIAVVIFWCFVILLPSLLAFYIFDAERVARNIGSFFMDAAIYPTGVLSGGLRVFLLTVLPGLFMASVPLEVLFRFGWQTVLFGAIVAAFWLGVSLWLFKRALRRYESSNLISAR